MHSKIGYFIPEFPGQTHIFLWRERQILEELGIEADLISTRRPPSAIASHTWAEEAQKNTVYLVPFSSKDFSIAAKEVLRAGLTGWLRCGRAITQAKDMSPVQKLRLFAMTLVAGKLAWLARTRGWSQIHAHSCADAAHIAMFASFLSGIPYSLTLHGPTLEVYGPNQEQKWKNASFAIVISERLCKDVKQKLAGFLPNQVVVAPMGVNLAVIKRHRPYKPWEEGTPCRIFSCGRLNPVKGHKYLIETIEQLRQQGFDARLQIAGEDEQGGSGYHLELEQLIQEKSLGDYVELLGAVSEQRVRQGLEEAHVFALASLNEGIPVAVMEAMAMEMPVVVTDVGGNSELIDNGVDGIMVQPEKPEEMTDAIAKVLNDKELAMSLVQKSRDKISTNFHHERSAKAIADCLGSTPDVLRPVEQPSLDLTPQIPSYLQ